MPAPRASLFAVTQKYKSRVALDHVSIDLTDGCTGLVGVNGAGKTTLLRVLSGALAPTGGTVSIGGSDPYRGRSRRVALARVALMPQAARLPGRMNAREVVTYLTWMRGFSCRESASRAIAALERVRLGPELDTQVRALSGGMVRRVLLAQALAARADVLLLDEPSTGLDPEQRHLMIEILRGLDGTVLLSSHVMEDIEDLVDRVVVLDKGRVLLDGAPADLAARSDDPAGARALESGFIRLLASRAEV